LASTWHFDAVISDIRMPEMNGLEFFRQALLADRDLQGRLIFITGGTNDEAANFAREYKIPILRKPFGFGELR
jgi:CheY-like chemotaxis protein